MIDQGYFITDWLLLPQQMRKILMKQDELLAALAGVKAELDAVGDGLDTVKRNLTDSTANLTEAVTEILAKIADLNNNFDLSPDVQAVVDALGVAASKVATETADIDTQAQAVGTQASTLAGIVPNPAPTPAI